MKNALERNLGEQPLKRIVEELKLKSHDLVEADPQRITHKLISRACKGRRLTTHSQKIVQEALNKVSKNSYHLSDLFNYAKTSNPDA